MTINEYISKNSERVFLYITLPSSMTINKYGFS